MTIHDILERFRQEALNNRDLGDKFERLIATYLVTDPMYADQYDAVWLWGEWPNRWGVDTGIDLVARERLTGEYVAIQCKFFDPAHALQKADIDSFFTASGKTFSTPSGARGFAKRVVVCTTDKWSKHAEESLMDQTIPVTRLRVQDLADSPIDWSQFSLQDPTALTLREKKQPRPHQKTAIASVLEGFKGSDRGKLIMACGTGKTFTSLKIAETMSGKGGAVLFLVPSISLLSQTLREWTAETEKPFHAFAVCSDTKVGRHHEDMAAHDLALPASTDPKRLANAVKLLHGDREMTVVFSTYQSISVVAEAQKLGLPEFDLIVCDEAHRTTGVTLEGDDESEFVRVHNQKFIKGKKRIYMTATPRIFADATKSKAEESDATLCSMDDESLYGPVFHRLGFGEAVGKGLLADYKVLVLAVDEKHISKALQNSLADTHNELNIDDATKIIGCWNGLAKRLIGDEAKNEDPAPMRRAVAFVRSIKDSKHLRDMFQGVVDEYLQKHGEESGNLSCEVEHVDGGFNVLARNRMLDWLKEDAGEGVCRILSNARCLSEGVDVPSLDAVLFLNPRDSVVDVVQSVGRVMRRADATGKKYGYVILPISVPAGVPPEVALKDNQRYRVVWQVLQALRAHDDRFNATVNQIELNKQRPNQIQVIGVGGGGDSTGEKKDPGTTQFSLNFPEIEAWKDAIYGKIVQKCGDRRYWEDWAKDVAKIAERHTARIEGLIEAGGKERKAFERFLSGLQENINPSIDRSEAIEMLSQHLITRPVFDALFENYSFAQNNPVSLAMQEVLDVLEANALEKEIESLKGFYESVRQRVKGIDNAEGRQRIVIELYDKFFKLAFPKMAQRLGIVYTPVEVVDFIIHSAEHALRDHFKVGLTDKNVHILDPFTGTGTFIARLLQSGLIKPKDLERKYKEELHANEIVLLAYYIAAINIEETFHGLQGGDYLPFDGIVLTDTFQMAEETGPKGFGEAMFPENNSRVKRQKARDIRVIVGNPPYSAQQDSQNDNNQNIAYPLLDGRIAETYANQSSAANKKNLYDSYIRAIRWATDRIKDQGIVGFVTNGSFLDANNMDGLRKSLTAEFSTVYCFNLRGNARTQGEQRRKEKGNVFDAGSRTPVAVTIMIKDPTHKSAHKLFYHDIGDYLTREEKLKIVGDFGSIRSIPWKTLTPNAEGDWINQRNPEFETFMLMGDKEGKEKALFSTYSLGVGTNRDSWAYNSSKAAVVRNMRSMIEVYNGEVDRYRLACEKNKTAPKIEDFVTNDPKKISWSSSLLPNVGRGRKAVFSKEKIVSAIYRPYEKTWLYFDGMMNHRVGQWPVIFPSPRHENIALSVTGIGASKAFSALVSNVIPNLHTLDSGQCFPLYWYEKAAAPKAGQSGGLFADQSAGQADAEGYVRRDAITDWALDQFRSHYGEKKISKEDVFYYVYGLLHSPDYRNKYESSLKKMLPRIPFVKDFKAFSKAGRDLAKWHLNYETIDPYPVKEESKEMALDPKALFRVEKMVFAKTGKEVDKSTIIFNSKVRLSGIPLEAYEYVVNGKPAIEWLIERYAVSIDKDSGIKNDPNDWSEDPRYIIDLVKRVIRVSVETVKIVKTLPAI